MEVDLSQTKRPWAVEFRSSEWFCTAVVFFSVFIDMLVYSIIIPVIPFRLEELGYQNPSALVGWLLVVYSLGLLLATPPLAFLAEKYWSRRMPLVFGIFLLVGSQALFMEAKTFWLMCFARALQGVSSATVWVVAFSLLCDTVPEQRIGQQLGIVMMGLTVGFLLGPPVGGALNDKLGYRAPFVLGMIVCILDLMGRFLTIEKHDAARWISGASNTESVDIRAESRQRSQLSPFRVIIKLARSRRAFTAFLNVFVYGCTFTMMEPTLPLRLQNVYGYTSLKVGIIYLAAVIPSIFSTPLAGRIADKMGTEWVTLGCLLATVPWWILMAIRSRLGLFVTSLALTDFFLAAVVTPVSADIAAAAREIEGIGYTHVFGAFNFAYSVGSVAGPLIGGEIYSRVKNGWTVLMGLSTGLVLFAVVMAAYGAGDRPLWTRLVERSIRLHGSEDENKAPTTTPEKTSKEV